MFNYKGGLPTNYKSPELSNLDFKEIIILASEKGNKNCVEALYNFLNAVGQIAFNERSLEYYADVLSWIRLLYHYCYPKQELADLAQQETIDSLNSLGPSTFQSYLWREKSHERHKEITPYIEQYLSWFLYIAVDVAKNGDEKTFKNMFAIIDPLLGSEYSPPREDYENTKMRVSYAPNNLDLQNDLAAKEVMLNIHCLVNLARIVISAWLAELCKVNKLNHKIASVLVEVALNKIKETTDLFEIYLQASGDVYRYSLGYGHWDHIDRLPGKSYSIGGTAFDRWIKPFWIVYALKFAGNNGLRFRKSTHIRLLASFREYHYQDLSKYIERIIANEEYYKWFAEKEDLEKGKECILKIFFEIKERQEQVDIEKLVSSPLSPAKISSFKNDCIEGYHGKNTIFKLCVEFGIARAQDVKKWSDIISKKFIDGKERFIEEWHDGFGNQKVFGEELAEKENYKLSKFIEDNLIKHSTIEDFNAISSKLKSVAGEMRSSGLSPNIILIPEDHRIQSVFTSKPAWQRESIYTKNDLPGWVSSFDGMEVFVWDRPEQTSIAIIDIQKYIGINALGNDMDDPLLFELKEISEAEIQSLLDKEKSKPIDQQGWHKELDEYKGSIKILSQIYLRYELSAKAKLGIVDEKAGIKLELDESKVGVLCDKAKKICHTIGCKIAATISKEQIEYYPTASYARSVCDYIPCEECDPLRGDIS